MKRDVIEAILQRRSVSKFEDDGEPSDDELALLIRAAATVPDHGELQPYRFVISQGEARARFADALEAAGREHAPDNPKIGEKLRSKAFAAPTQILLIASPREGMKIPEWEQIATASCTGYAIALAAHAIGLGAIWKSAGIMDGEKIREVLEMKPAERLLGWVNVGRPEKSSKKERDKVDPSKVASVLRVKKALKPFG